LVPVGDSAALGVAIGAVLDSSRVNPRNTRERAMAFDLRSAVDAYLEVFQLPMSAA